MNNYNSTYVPENINILKNSRRILFISLLLCWIFQVFIGDIYNAVSSTIIFFTSWLTYSIILRTNIINNAVLPSFVVLSFNFSLFTGPIIFQTIYLNPVTNNLITPLTTFSISSIFQLVMLFVLVLFISSKELNLFSRALTNKIYKPLGLMTIPTTNQIWIMGVIGLLATLWKASTTMEGGVQFGDASGQFIASLRFFTYSPFLIPILNKLSPENVKWNIAQKNLLIIYFLVLIILAMATNSRSVFATGLIIILFIYLIYMLLGLFNITKKIIYRILISILLIIYLFPIFSDIAMAMILARSDRNSASTTELIQITVEKFQDKKAIEYKKSLDNSRINGLDYNETYIDNLFLQRLLYIKMFDNVFSLDNVINGKYSEKIISTSIDHLLATLPTPVLKIFEINIDKSNLAYSMGDYLHYLEGVSNLGEFKVGASTAHGYAMFGILSFFIMVPIYLIFFTVLQSFSSGYGKNTAISIAIMLKLFTLYTISQNDNFFGVLTMVLRGFLQIIFLYLMVFYFASIVTKYKIKLR